MFLVRRIAIFLLFSSTVAQDCGTTLTWSTGNGNILLNGQPFVLKGVNYFGFETDTYAPHGIWSYSLDGILDFIKNNNFNAIRLPFSMELVMTNPAHPNVNCGANPTICNLNALDLMEAFIDRCAARGILVMLDNHLLSHSGGITELWYDSGTYTEANVLAGWDTLLSRFGSKWNVFAIDLKNEPHGAATWGYLNQATDWDLAAQRFISYLAAHHPDYKGLFFVEGVGESASSPNTNSPTHFWAENLEGVTWHPVATGNASLDSRIVYSPHVYGPDVYNQGYFQTGNFPTNMPDIWNMHFGYVESLTGHPIVIGEWGGWYTSGSPDETWENAMANWLRSNCMTDQFYWCVNPNSGDTGGLLGDDWSTPNTRKLNLLTNVVPYPTNFTYASGQICVTHGWFANSACGGSSQTTTPSSSTASTASSSSATTTASSSSASTTTPPATSSTASTSSSSGLTGQNCGTTLTWSTGNRHILLNGQPFVLKGVNYFGFETETFAPHGLWSYSLDGILDFVKNNNFNAIRIPFSMELVMTNPSHPNVNCGANPTICNLNALDLMEAFIDRCAARGILVMLDNQRLWQGSGITELWYDSGTFTEANVLSYWDTLLNRFGSKWNLFAIDLKNEPHGAATWGYLNQATDWNLAAQRFISYLAANHPNYKGLFFVEGVSESASSPNTNSPGHFWGENLEGVTWHPVATGDASLDARIVYSPHVYGPDVFNMDYFQTSSFPSNMPDIWNMHFGYVQNLTGKPVVLGEWGGWYTAGSPDETWQNALADWLRANCMSDQFYWCLNPNGGDTGGLLGDDWSTPNTRKLNLLAGVVPYPTNFTYASGQVCVVHGWYVNSACGGGSNQTTTSLSSSASTASSSSASTTATSSSASTTTSSTTTPSATTPPTTSSTASTSSNTGSTGQNCGTTLTWSTGNGNILLNGQPFVLKGVNYFGFETDTYAPHGIWSYSLDGILDFIKNNNFNAIRLPFSMELVMTNPAHPNVNCGANPTICNLNALDLMEAFIDRCAARGILVMLDNHLLSHSGGITELWYDSGTYTEANVLAGWDTLLSRFGSKWNVFAIDLKNEPHGAATWGYLNQATDWDLAAQRFISYLASRHPDYKGLFFVEGVGESASSPNTNSPTHFWAENLEGVTWHPVATGNASLDSRIVYSPHVYGPDVYNQGYFQTGTFPTNMPDIWNMHFGYVESLTGHPIVIGEWGGWYTSGSPDETWENAMANWLRSNCMTDQFYWCVNPNSGDTGGLLGDDWSTPNTRKLNLLAGVVPYPTNFTYSSGQICTTHGSFANSACGSGSTTSSSSSSTASTASSSSSSSSTTTPSTTVSTASTSSSTASSTTTQSGAGSGQVSYSITQTNSWETSGLPYKQIAIAITNNGPSTICDMTIQMTPSTTTVSDYWNLVSIGNGEYTFPSWEDLPAGQTFTPGMTLQTTTLSTFSTVSIQTC